MILIICIIGLIVCEILENVLWEKDREKALGYGFEQKKERRIEV